MSNRSSWITREKAMFIIFSQRRKRERDEIAIFNYLPLCSSAHEQVTELRSLFLCSPKHAGQPKIGNHKIKLPHLGAGA